ncbi:hypothetical protein Trydic_g19618 [Trypoxylus dichotomus]
MSGCRISGETTYVCTNDIEIADAWKTYIKQPFNDTRPEPPEVVDDMGLNFLVDEVTEAVNSMKGVKSSGPNNINIVILKPLDDDSVRWT